MPNVEEFYPYQQVLPLESCGDVIYTFYHETDRFTDITIETFDCIPGPVLPTVPRHKCKSKVTTAPSKPSTDTACTWFKTVSFVAGDYLLHIKNLGAALSSVNTCGTGNTLYCHPYNTGLDQALPHLGPNDPIVVENDVQLPSVDVPDHVVCLKGHVTGYKFVVSDETKQK